VPVIIPHFGAGMFREALMAGRPVPNMYLDTSSSNNWLKYHPGPHARSPSARHSPSLGPQRLMFGTDSSFFPRGWHRVIYNLQRTALVNVGVPEAEQAAIFGGNFERLLG
jgi:uncharacterized protein